MTERKLPDFVERLMAGERLFLPHATHEDVRFASPLYNRVKSRGKFIHFRQGTQDGVPGLFAWVDGESGRTPRSSTSRVFAGAQPAGDAIKEVLP